MVVTPSVMGSIVKLPRTYPFGNGKDDFYVVVAFVYEYTCLSVYAYVYMHVYVYWCVYATICK